MSAGPIQQARDASVVAPPWVPKKGDVVRIVAEGILAPFPLWRVAIDTTGLAPDDTVVLEPMNPACPLGRTSRRIRTLRPSKEKP